MSFWQKITVGVKFLFGGFESATDYLFDILNQWLLADDVSQKVYEYQAKARQVYDLLVKYNEYCPVKWVDAYAQTLEAVKVVVDAFEDAQITEEEVKKAVEGFKKAYELWCD